MTGKEKFPLGSVWSRNGCNFHVTVHGYLHGDLLLRTEQSIDIRLDTEYFLRLYSRIDVNETPLALGAETSR